MGTKEFWKKLRERANCSVRAVSFCMNISYFDAYSRLESLGRKKGCGFNLSPHKDKLGLITRPELSCRQFDKILPELSNGRYIIFVSGHYFAVVNGVVINNLKTNMKCRVKMVYELLS